MTYLLFSSSWVFLSCGFGLDLVLSVLGLFRALLTCCECYLCYLVLSRVTGVTPKKSKFLQLGDPFGDNLCGENHYLWVNHIAVTTRCSDESIG